MTERHHNAAILPSLPLALVFGSLALGCAVPAALYFPTWIAAAAGLIVLSCGARAISVHALGRTTNAIVTLRFGSLGLELESRDGHWAQAKGVRGSFVHPLLTIVAIRGERLSFMRRYLVVVPGRMDKDDFRWLRVWLRWRNADLEEGLA